MQNEENRLTSVILDKSNGNTISKSSACKYIGQMGSKGQSGWSDNDIGF